MAQPANLPRWNDTLANQTDPPSLQKDTGWTVSQPLVSSYLNWLLYTIYLWTVYVKNIGAEALTWTAAHIFQRGITVSNSLLNGFGVDSTGNGTGAGVRGTGGSNSAGVIGVAGAFGVGVQGTGGTGGSGGYFVGGPTNGSGVEGYAGGGNAYGFFGQGSGTGAGANVTGGATGPGVKGTGGSTGGIGVDGTGTGSSAGVKGQGATGGVGVSGQGGQFTGGSPTIGAGSAGVYAVGGTSAPGLIAEGKGTSPGLTSVGGPNFGPGARFDNGANTFYPAVDCRGSIDLLNASVPSINFGQASKLTKLSLCKALLHFSCNGGASPALNWGQNVQSLNQNSDGSLDIVWANSFASADYLVEGQSQEGYAVAGGNYRLIVKPGTQTTLGVTLQIEAIGVALTPSLINRAGSSGVKFVILAWGLH